MIIAIDGRSLQGAQGGVDIYVYQLLTHFFTHHANHSYILFFNGSKRIVNPFKSYQCLQVIHTGIPSKLFNASLALVHRPKLDVLLERVSGKRIDLFFLPNLNFAAFSQHVKIVLTIHDLSFVHYRLQQSRKSRWWHASLRPETLIHRSQHIIAVSENTKKDVVSTFGIDSSKISTIHLGVENTNLPDRGSTGELPMILAFCPQEKRKNIEALIEAFSCARLSDERLDNAYLVLAGVSTLPPSIKNTIRKLRLTKWVHIVRAVSRDHRLALLRSARICAYPSIYEGFGFPPLEANLMGVPVIAGAHSCLPEISGSTAWLCDPYNITELSHAMITLYTDEGIRGSLIRGSATITQKYQWSETARQTIQLFEKVCE